MHTTTVFGSASPSAFHRGRRCDVDWRPRLLLPEGDDHGAGGAGAAGAAGAGSGGAGQAGAGAGAAGAGEGAGSGGAGGAAVPTATQQAAEKYGFPVGTPVEEMTPEQQVGYFKASKDAWEGRFRALGVTPEQLQELRTKAKRAEDLDYELASDKDKAVADAKREAEEETRKAFIPELVTAKFEAAIGDRLTEDQLAKVLEPLDLTKFLDASGKKVDTAKVRAHAEIIAPAKGNGTGQRGPSASGQGQRNSGGKASGMGAGRDMFAESRRSKTSTTAP